MAEIILSGGTPITIPDAVSSNSATSAARVVSGAPNAKDYSIGNVSQGNIFERFGDYFSGYDRINSQNSAQAILDKQWEFDSNKYLDSTRYQRAVADLKAAGLNPWLALNGGSFSPGSASVSGSSAHTFKDKSFKPSSSVFKDIINTAVKSALFLSLLAA